MSDTAPMIDPGELRDALRAGDTLVRCLGAAEEWHMARAGTVVAAATVECLQARLDSAPGALVPLGDGLPGLGASQSYGWRE